MCKDWLSHQFALWVSKSTLESKMLLMWSGSWIHYCNKYAFLSEDPGKSVSFVCNTIAGQSYLCKNSGFASLSRDAGFLCYLHSPLPTLWLYSTFKWGNKNIPYTPFIKSLIVSLSYEDPHQSFKSRYIYTCWFSLMLPYIFCLGFFPQIPKLSFIVILCRKPLCILNIQPRLL